MSLIQELEQMHKVSRSNPGQAANRNRAESIRQAIDALFASTEAQAQFEQKMRIAATNGKKSAYIGAWRKHECPHFNNENLLELLTVNNELLEKIQDWLDEHYRESDERRFRVFYSEAKGLYSVVVSWDIQGFENIDDIIHRQKQQQQKTQSKPTGTWNRNSQRRTNWGRGRQHKN